ncbi:MAG: hypothetical protein AVDCRST_MAG50-582, partial [uncultured Acidimicrobiales bacterium]
WRRTKAFSSCARPCSRLRSATAAFVSVCRGPGTITSNGSGRSGISTLAWRSGSRTCGRRTRDRAMTRIARTSETCRRQSWRRPSRPSWRLRWMRRQTERPRSRADA